MTTKKRTPRRGREIDSRLQTAITAIATQRGVSYNHLGWELAGYTQDSNYLQQIMDDPKENHISVKRHDTLVTAVRLNYPAIYNHAFNIPTEPPVPEPELTVPYKNFYDRVLQNIDDIVLVRTTPLPNDQVGVFFTAKDPYRVSPDKFRGFIGKLVQDFPDFYLGQYYLPALRQQNAHVFRDRDYIIYIAKFRFAEELAKEYYFQSRNLGVANHEQSV